MTKRRRRIRTRQEDINTKRIRHTTEDTQKTTMAKKKHKEKNTE